MSHNGIIKEIETQRDFLAARAAKFAGEIEDKNAEIERLKARIADMEKPPPEPKE